MLNRRVFYLRLRGYDQIENILTTIEYSFTREKINRFKEGRMNNREKFQFFNRVKRHLERKTRENIVYLVIDDIDEGSQEILSLIDFLISHLRDERILFILSTVNPLLTRDRSLLDIPLKKLNKKEISTIIRSILFTDYISRSFSDFLYRESQGNLRYLEYIINDLYNRGELYMSEKGNWTTRTSDYYGIDISPDKDNLINTYLDNLDSKNLQLLQVMSVFKNRINITILSKIIGIERKKLYKILNKLEENKIIEYKATSINSKCIFQSPEFKKVLYNRLGEEEKELYHRRIGNILYKKYINRDSIEIKILLYHLIKSNQENKAIGISLKELEIKNNIFNTYTISILEMVYNMIRDKKAKGLEKILDKLIRIYLIRGDIGSSRYYLDRLYNLAREKDNIRYMLKAEYYKASLYIRSGEFNKVETIADKIDNLARENKMSDELISGLVIKAKLGLNKNDLSMVPEALEKSIDLSKKLNTSYRLDTIYNLLGIYHYFKGDISKSIKCFKKCISLAEVEGDKIEGIRAVNNLGNIYNSIYGDRDQALKYYQQGYKMADKYGFIQASIIFSNNIGDIHLKDLQYRKGFLYFERVKEAAIDTDDTRGKIISIMSLGNLYLDTGQYNKLFNLYSQFKDLIFNNLDLDTNIKGKYYSLLGESYGRFGFMDKGLVNLWKAKDKYEKNNTREFLIVKAHILELDYYDKGYYSRSKIEEILEEFLEVHTLNFRLRYIFRFGLISYKESDLNFLRNLWHKFKDLIECKNKKDIDRIIIDFKAVFKIMLVNSKYDLDRLEKDYLDRKCSYLYLDYIYNFIIGERYFNFKDYNKSIKYILKALDILYDKIDTIKYDSIKYNLIKTRQGDYLKEILKQAIKDQYDVDFNYTSLQDVKYVGYRNYREIKNIIKLFTDDELFSIKEFEKEENRIRSFEDLMSKISSDYKENLNNILSFIRYKTLADRGSIIYFDTKEDRYKILTSIGKKNQKTPNENLFLQANRSRTGIVVNKSLPYIEKTIYKEFLPEDKVAIICIPLYNEKNRIINDRRKNLLGSQCKGYIYLEAGSYINKFNYENLIFLNKLSNLTCLNIDNYKLNWISTTDKLTGVLTKNYFDLIIEKLMGREDNYRSQFSLLMLDIDDFKKINDNFGHLKGDKVLSLIGEELTNNIRDGDIVARYGGEEFILILFNTTLDQGFKIGQRIKDNIENKYIPEIKGNVTVSIGLSQYPEHGQGSRELIEKADQALYEAKEKIDKNTILSWDLDIGERIEEVDRLAGIYTGDSVQDSKNMSAILDVVELIQGNKSKREKTSRLLEILIDILECEYIAIFKVEDTTFNILESRIRSKRELEKDYKINKEVIKRVIDNRKGEFLIDWDNVIEFEDSGNIPIWRSIMVVPLIKKGKIKKLIYTSVPLKEGEFNFQDLNFSKLLLSIFIESLD